jgi:OPA family glycerol-3-phosphate transporter-like MFS transporter/OPA family sugar phosphate sensor protein UhpC-like MFS transporter
MTAEIQKKFIKAQWRFIAFSAISYAFFYIARKNLSMAQPAMLEEGVISTYALGIVMTVHGVLYGLSRFINGFWADRLNGRIFMAIGLALSAATNFFFGCSSLTLFFALFWILNGWAQGMGFPPCAKMLAHWIHPRELATKMSVWNASHSVGAVLALGLCSALFALGFGWRWCFWVPAALAVAAAVFTFLCVKETPVEAGLPPLELESAVQGKSGTLSSAERRRLVFGNRVIWLVALANFFVYVVRFGFLDWGPTFLKQMKGIPVAKGGLMIIAFELAAVVGTVCAGWVTDKVFKGRGCRTGVFFMLFAAAFAFGFWLLPEGAPAWQATLLLMGAGFCIYGPQALTGIIVANQATKEAAALATGFAGIMGYLSTTVSGIGIAFIKETFGWGVTLCAVAFFALVGMALFLCAWSARADGYGQS